MTTASPHRILLVPDARPRAAGDTPRIRRYRLARLRVAAAREPSDPRLAQVAKGYD